MSSDELQSLCQALGHVFAEQDLLAEALRHRSMRGKNNERLEFLGDSLVNCIIAAALFAQFPSAKEGQLSRLRAHLVRGETLAELAHEFHLGDHLTLGAGESKSGGRHRQSLLADALEAVVAAIYLDAGFDTTQSCVLAWFASRLANISLDAPLKDPKTCLQEYLQAKHLPLPEYHIHTISGADHAQEFAVRCEVPGLAIRTQGQGSSRRKAEQAAAAAFLEKLEGE